jgi:hypothetical protein
MNSKLVVTATAIALAMGGWVPGARAAQDKVVIGVMNDMSSIYSYLGGMGSVAAANMADRSDLRGPPAKTRCRRQHRRSLVR